MNRDNVILIDLDLDEFLLNLHSYVGLVLLFQWVVTADETQPDNAE